MAQRVVLDPFVALSLMEHAIRYNTERPEGILLGSHVKNVTEIRNFVPGLEDEFIRLTIRGSPRDLAVGWYTADLSDSEHNKSVQDRIDENVHRPVFLHVQVPSEEEEDAEPSFRAFVKNTIVFASGKEVSCLKEVAVDIASGNADTNIALDAMVSSFFPETALEADPARVPATASGDDPYLHLRKIKEMLVTAKKYVDEVTAGKITGDKATARSLSALLSATEAKQRAAAASGIIDEKTNDALMLQYLGRLIGRQVNTIEEQNNKR